MVLSRERGLLWTVMALLLVVTPEQVTATVRLPQWFGDGMVLQTSEENGPTAFLAGITEPAGEKVTIGGDVGEYTVTSEAGSGHWKVTLDASSVWKNPTSMTITVVGATGPQVTATGVQAGDVYFCAGQSNMLFSLHQALNYTAEAATLASYPNFRFFMTNRALNSTAQWDLTTDSANCDAAAPYVPPPLPTPAPSPPSGPVGCFPDDWQKDIAWKTGPGLGDAPAVSAAECCSFCGNVTMQKKGCKGWSWVPTATFKGDPTPGGGTCWMKNVLGGKAIGNKGGASGGVRKIGPPPPSGSCSASGFLNNTAFGHGHGPSIGNAPAKDATDCCTQCFSAEWAGKGCSFFTFEGESTSVGGTTAGGTCWFKTNDHGPALQRLGCISGGHPSTPPPAPPKPCNKWVTPAEASADNSAFLLTFSAVCFMTVRDIARQHTHDRPMGLIQSAWGGSRLEAWMSDEALASAGAPVAGNIPLNNNKSPAGAANDKSSLYNGMVSPWTNFSVKAVLWYQGEENADQSCQVNSTMWPGPAAAHTQPVEYYAVAYEAMIRDWRQKKGVRFPLGTMQLPPSVKTGIDPATSNPMWAGRPDIRGAEAISSAHPAGNTTDVSGVAVTIDLGGASNWGDDHPPNKNEMSRRLSLQLLHTAYGLGQESIPLWTGPVLEGVRTNHVAEGGSEIRLTFTTMSSAGGLSLRDVKAPTSVDDGRGGVASASNNCTKCCDGGGAPFEVTSDQGASTARLNGRNLTWVRFPLANITVGPGAVVALKVGTGAELTGLRYAWTDFVDCVLDNGNSSGIPAGPFRHWF